MATAQVLQPRPLRGSRISSFYPVKSLPPISSLDSAFQLQEYISLLIRLDVHDVDTITKMPTQAGVDQSCWIYEQLRRLSQDLSHPLITMLQTECTRQSCNEMKAGEWLYLCVAHGNDGAMERCCAIDYILHTLDSATALLNSPRAFPSRLQIPPSSRRHFSSLARRLGRIFAHAYFHHRELFEQAEVESSLYARFLKLVETNDLVPAEFLVIPTTRDSHEEHSPQPPRLYGAALHSDEAPSSYITDHNHNPIHTEDPLKTDSPSPPRSGSESPRKPTGRSRTDTMVYTDAAAFIEELASKSPTENPLDSARTAVLELDITPASSAPPPPTKTPPESSPQQLQQPAEMSPETQTQEPLLSQAPEPVVEIQPVTLATETPEVESLVAEEVPVPIEPEVPPPKAEEVPEAKEEEEAEIEPLEEKHVAERVKELEVEEEQEVVKEQEQELVKEQEQEAVKDQEAEKEPEVSLQEPEKEQEVVNVQEIEIEKGQEEKPEEPTPAPVPVTAEEKPDPVRDVAELKVEQSGVSDASLPTASSKEEKAEVVI